MWFFCSQRGFVWSVPIRCGAPGDGNQVKKSNQCGLPVASGCCGSGGQFAIRNSPSCPWSHDRSGGGYSVLGRRDATGSGAVLGSVHRDSQVEGPFCR